MGKDLELKNEEVPNLIEIEEMIRRFDDINFSDKYIGKILLFRIEFYSISLGKQAKTEFLRGFSEDKNKDNHIMIFKNFCNELGGMGLEVEIDYDSDEKDEAGKKLYIYKTLRVSGKHFKDLVIQVRGGTDMQMADDGRRVLVKDSDYYEGSVRKEIQKIMATCGHEQLIPMG